MNQQIAIIVAGALIAAAIALTNHWEPIQGGLLNRWTGTIFVCGVDSATAEIVCPPAQYRH